MPLKPSLFLSHAAKDGESISLLKDRLVGLTGGSIDIFVSSDGQSIPFGRNWVHEVEEALKRAKLMYVFISPAALESKWVPFEAGYAYSRKIRVVPVGISGVDLSTIGPPLGLLQGFNISSGPGMNNIVKIINDEFECSFPETLETKDYEGIFLSRQTQSESLLGKYSSLAYEIVFTAQCVHSRESHAIQNFFTEKGFFYTADGFNLNAPGISFPLHQGPIEIQVDPSLSALNFKLLEDLIPFMGGDDFNDSFHLKIYFSSPVRSVDQPHRLSAKIFGSELKLVEKGRVALNELHLGLQQLQRTIGASETNAIFKTARSFIEHRVPNGVEVEAFYTGPHLSEAPLAQALDTLFRVGALFFDSQ